MFLVLLTLAFVIGSADSHVVILSGTDQKVWDPFTFIFQITCNLYNKPAYWYNVQFLENDFLFSGEWITKRFEERMTPGTISRIYKGAMNGDEPFSDGYSVTAIFNHDCTSNGEKVEAQFEFKTRCPLQRPCNMKYHADLTNQKGHKSVFDNVIVIL